MISTFEIDVETRRIARRMVMDAIRQAGIRTSSIKAVEITTAVKVLVSQRPDIREIAVINLSLTQLIKSWGDWSHYAATGEWQ